MLEDLQAHIHDYRIIRWSRVRRRFQILIQLILKSWDVLLLIASQGGRKPQRSLLVFLVLFSNTVERRSHGFCFT